jgi:DNA-binding NarL/FixJ family response regulator
MIRIMLVDDQALIREGLRVLLPLHGDLEIVGEAAHGGEALERLHALAGGVDVVLMDIRMPGVDGIAATREIVRAWPACRVLLLTTFDDDAYIFTGLRVGAKGYLLKDTPSDKLAEAIRAVWRGETVLQPSVAGKVVAELTRLSDAPAPTTAKPLAEPLTERELQILRAMAEAHSNKEIATTLFLSEGTVKNYVTNILTKLGARDRLHAVNRARELGVI